MDSKDALQWEQQRRAALLVGDVAALDALLAEALIYVHSTGGRDSKASYLEKIRSGALRYLSLEFDDLQVQPSEHAALVTGRMRATVLRGGQELQVRSLFLTVWLAEGPAQNRVWRLAAHQGTNAA